MSPIDDASSMATTVLYSVPTTESVRSAVAAAHGLSIDECRFLHHGFNDTYELVTGKTTCYLRLYRHGWRTKNEIDCELALLEYLADKGLPVSAPQRTTAGTFTTVLQCPEGNRDGALFSAAPGSVPLELTATDLADLGHLLGRLHRLADEWSGPINRPLLDGAALVAGPLDVLERAFPGRRQQIRELGFQLTAVRSVDATVAKTAPAYGLLHGDFLRVNFHHDAGSFTLFDFDFCAVGYRLYDLATFKWSLLKTCPEQAQADFEIFLNQYRKVLTYPGPLSKLIDDFVAARQLWVWATNVKWGEDWRRLTGHSFDAHYEALEDLLGPHGG